MAQLALINSKSYSEKDNRQVGDIAAVFDDSHVFSEHEKEIFDIVKTDMDRSTIDLFKPAVKKVFKAKSIDWELDPPEEKDVWLDTDGNHKEIVVMPVFSMRYEDGTFKENYSRENTDPPVLISAIRSIEREL